MSRATQGRTLPIGRRIFDQAWLLKATSQLDQRDLAPVAGVHTAHPGPACRASGLSRPVSPEARS